ncbi:hypothetical protein SLE2022_285730 [Rubroshorea leprosula]
MGRKVAIVGLAHSTIIPGLGLDQNLNFMAPAWILLPDSPTNTVSFPIIFHFLPSIFFSLFLPKVVWCQFEISQFLQSKSVFEETVTPGSCALVIQEIVLYSLIQSASFIRSQYEQPVWKRTG